MSTKSLHFFLFIIDPLERESVITSQLEEFINYNFTVTISTSIGPNAPGDTPSDVQITTNEAGKNIYLLKYLKLDIFPSYSSNCVSH